MGEEYEYDVPAEYRNHYGCGLDAAMRKSPLGYCAECNAVFRNIGDRWSHPGITGSICERCYREKNSLSPAEPPTIVPALDLAVLRDALREAKGEIDDLKRERDEARRDLAACIPQKILDQVRATLRTPDGVKITEHAATVVAARDGLGDLIDGFHAAMPADTLGMPLAHGVRKILAERDAARAEVERLKAQVYTMHVSIVRDGKGDGVLRFHVGDRVIAEVPASGGVTLTLTMGPLGWTVLDPRTLVERAPAPTYGPSPLRRVAALWRALFRRPTRPKSIEVKFERETEMDFTYPGALQAIQPTHREWTAPAAGPVTPVSRACADAARGPCTGAVQFFQGQNADLCPGHARGRIAPKPRTRIFARFAKVGMSLAAAGAAAWAVLA